MLASLNTVGLCYTATHGRIFKTFERVFGLDNKGPIKSNERLKRRAGAWIYSLKQPPG